MKRVFQAKGFRQGRRKTELAGKPFEAGSPTKKKLEAAFNDDNIETRKIRRLAGGGRKPLFPGLEERLILFVEQKNVKSLQVKDFYIGRQALNIFKELKAEGLVEPDAVFSASPGWIFRFKCRHNFVSRRQTSTRLLPIGADDICRKFIHIVRQTIKNYGIKIRNIINMDQVPRYFESEPKTTIIEKGSREVLLRKRGTSHKWFTTTFAIIAITDEEKFLKPHVLFSGLKNKPSVNLAAMVDVNKTGMWNEEILMRYCKEAVMSRKKTAFFQEPTLLIIYSYGPHVKLAESRNLEKWNIYVTIVPPNLNSRMQPLDVVVNRIFQAFYRTL